MLQITTIKQQNSAIISALKKKNFNAEKIIEKIIVLDDKRIAIQKDLNLLQQNMNSISKEIGLSFSKNKKEQAKKLQTESKRLSSTLKS